MKKILRIISLFIITLGSILIFKGTAYATGCDGVENCRVGSYGTILASKSGNTTVRSLTSSTSTNHSRSSYTYSSRGVTFYVGGGNYSSNYFELHSSSRGGSIYCLDAGLNSVSTLYAYRFLIDSNNGTKTQAQDYALMAILTQASSYDNWAVQTAVRAIVISFGNDYRCNESSGYCSSASGNSYNNSHYAVYGTIGGWINNDSSVSSLYDSVNAALASSGYSLTSKSTLTDRYSARTYFSGGDVLTVAKKLYVDGMQAALDYLQNGDSTGGNITNATGGAYQEVMDSEDAIGTLVTAKVTHTFNVGGFSSSDDAASITINEIQFTDGVPTGLLEYYVSEIKYGDVTLTFSSSDNVYNTNIIDLFPDGTDFSETKEMQITLTFKGYKSVNDGSVYDPLKCGSQPIKYTLSGSYASSGSGNSKYSNYVGVIWYYSTSTTSQRYVSIEAAGADNSTGTSGTWSTGEQELEMVPACDCDTLIEACVAADDWSSDACEEVREQDCDDCDVLIELCVATDDWNSDVCQEVRDQGCDDCDALIELCLASDDPESDVCQALEAEDCDDCEVLATLCELGDEDACEEYEELECEESEEEEEAESVTCTTTITNFDCCDAEDDTLLIEGVAGVDKQEVKITGPEDVVACFVTQIDAQISSSNGYSSAPGAVDDVDNSYTSQQNKYCVVSCKEDYVMNMPLAQLTNAGRYFTFDADVTATKTCYTNTINIGDSQTEGSYIYDIVEIQKEIMNYYNEYLKWSTLAENISIGNLDTDRYNTDAYCTGSCGVSASTARYYPTWQSEATVSGWLDVDNATINEETGEVTVRTINQDVTDDEVNLEYQRPTGCSVVYPCDGAIDRDGNSCSASSGVEVCTGDLQEINSENDYYDALMAKADDALEKLDNAITKLESIVEEFNECNNWTVDDDFYQLQIYYDYEEDYIAEYYNNIGKMQETSSSSTGELWYCDGTLSDDAYEACRGTLATTEMIETVGYIICDDSGCDTEDYDISLADYIKKSSTVEKSYIPATLFYNEYPSGSVGKYDQDDGDTLDTNQVALENSLPVALGTDRGIYKYTLNMTNIGEYYDQDGVYGRLVGNGATSVFSSTNNDYVINNPVTLNGSSYNESLQYMCSYLVNIDVSTIDYLVCDMDPECTDGNCFSECVGSGCDTFCVEDCDSDCVGSGCYPCTTEDDCIPDCVGSGCAYDLTSGSLYYERTVSLTNLFPNGTEAFNWTNEKGVTATSEIEAAGNEIYNETPILSVTITPSASRSIEAYNDDAESSNGYSNSTLTCYSIGGYEMISCYSSFITDLMSGVYGDIVNDRSLVNSVRSEGADDTDYFTTWDNVDETQMMGPSYK